MTATAKPTVPDVAPLVWALYDSEHGEATGGCLHIVLDDGNLGDDDVDFCIERADKAGCVRCRHLGMILRQMSRTQRGVLYRLSHTRPEQRRVLAEQWGVEPIREAG